MAHRLDGKVALVTGASRGIGRAIAARFREEGARLVIVGRTDGVERVAQELGEGCLGVQADVTNGADIGRVIDEVLNAHGRLDVLCNNAGVDGDIGPIIDCSDDNYDLVMGVNLRGVFLGMRQAIPVMLDNGGGCIVNVASVAGIVGVPGCAVYSASKAGAIALTKTAALEYADRGIRVNALCPGGVDTQMHQGHDGDYSADGLAQMTPMKRLASLSEMASVATFLASDESSYLTGTVIAADGGYTAK